MPTVHLSCVGDGAGGHLSQSKKTELFIRSFARVYTSNSICVALDWLFPFFIVTGYVFTDWLYKDWCFLLSHAHAPWLSPYR